MRASRGSCLSTSAGTWASSVRHRGPFWRVAVLEPTNNVAERALRPAVLWRKGSFGSDSAAGSRFAERLLTLVATCRQQGRPLLAFLVAAGEAALRGTTAPSLLPAPLG